jgi:hypothetical protein
LAEKLQKRDREYKELIRLAIPIYKAMHPSNPWFQARMSNDYFWSQYISSRIVGAQRLVARHCGVFIPLQCHETPDTELQQYLPDWQETQAGELSGQTDP